jgi:hypothetical protein
MFAARIDSMIAAVRDKVCPRNRPSATRTYQGVVFGVSLDLSAWHEKRRVRIEAKASGFVLIYGQTTVFTALQRDFLGWRNFKEVPLDCWQHYTSHDDCWRSLQPLSTLYFELAGEVNGQLPEPIAPAHLHDHSMIGGLWLPAWELVTVTDTRDETDPNNYRRKIVGLERRD